jgi:hypothetical protein
MGPMRTAPAQHGTAQHSTAQLADCRQLCADELLLPAVWNPPNAEPIVMERVASDVECRPEGPLSWIHTKVGRPQLPTPGSSMRLGHATSCRGLIMGAL